MLERWDGVQGGTSNPPAVQKILFALVRSVFTEDIGVEMNMGTGSASQAVVLHSRKFIPSCVLTERPEGTLRGTLRRVRTPYRACYVEVIHAKRPWLYFAPRRQAICDCWCLTKAPRCQHA